MMAEPGMVSPLPVEPWEPIYQLLSRLRLIDGATSPSTLASPQSTSTTPISNSPIPALRMASALSRLATLCGSDPAFRASPPVTSLLEKVLDAFDVRELPATVVMQVLRFVGNACADADVNRKIAIPAYDRLEACLVESRGGRREWWVVVLSVMFNVCNDYKPAQLAFLRQGLHARVMSCLEVDTEGALSHGIMIDLLISLMTSENEDVAEEEELDRLLATSTMTKPQFVGRAIELLNTDILEDEDFASLLEFTACYLIQEEMVSSHGPAELPYKLSKLLRKQVAFSHRVARRRALEGPSEQPQQQPDGDEHRQPETKAAEEDVMAENRLSLSTHRVMNALCSLPSYDALDPNNIPASNSFKIGAELIRPANSDTEQITGWLVLGNICLADDLCVGVVKQTDLPRKAIISLLERAAPATVYPSLQKDFVHAATGFLRHLAISQANRPAIGNQGGVEAALACIAATDVDPDVIGCGLALAVQLVGGCPENCERAVSLPPPPRVQVVGPVPLVNVVQGLFGTMMGKYDAAAARFLALLYKGLYKHADPAATAAVATRATAQALLCHALDESPSDGNAFVDVWFSVALLSTSQVGASLLAECLALSSRDPNSYNAQQRAFDNQNTDSQLDVRRQLAASGQNVGVLPRRCYPPLSWDRFSRAVKSLRGADGITTSLPPALRTKLAQNALLLTSQMLGFARLNDVGLTLPLRRDLEGILRLAAMNDQTAVNGHPI